MTIEDEIKKAKGKPRKMVQLKGKTSTDRHTANEAKIEELYNKIIELESRLVQLEKKV